MLLIYVLYNAVKHLGSISLFANQNLTSTHDHLHHRCNSSRRLPNLHEIHLLKMLMTEGYRMTLTNHCLHYRKGRLPQGNRFCNIPQLGTR